MLKTSQLKFWILILIIQFNINACVMLNSENNPSVSQNNNVNSNTIIIPEDDGIVWYPFAWGIDIANKDATSSNQVIDILQLRNISVVIKNQKNNTEQQLKLLSDEGTQSSNAVLDSSSTQRNFFLPHFFKLKPGKYSIESISMQSIDLQSQKSTEIRIPIQNPFTSPVTNGISFSVSAGKISALPRMVMQTSMFKSTTQSEVFVLDSNAIPTNIILNKLGKTNKYSNKIFAAATDFPRSRLELPLFDESFLFEEALAKVGFTVDIPCQTQGKIRLGLRRINDEREYYSVYDLSGKEPKDCSNIYTQSLFFYLPKGDWLLKGFDIIPNINASLPQKLKLINKPTEYVINYFGLNSNLEYPGVLVPETELSRQLVIRLDSMLKTENTNSIPPDLIYNPKTQKNNSLLYLGRFELSHVKSGTDPLLHTESKQKRSFSLAEIKKQFSIDVVVNAYTLTKIIRERAKGTVKSILRIGSFDTNQEKKLNKITTEFRKISTENLAKCITDREEMDPLVSISGKMFFSVLRNTNSVNVKSFAFPINGLSERWVEECFQKKILAFRFSSPAPLTFNGELEFMTE